MAVGDAKIMTKDAKQDVSYSVVLVLLSLSLLSSLLLSSLFVLQCLRKLLVTTVVAVLTVVQLLALVHELCSDEMILAPSCSSSSSSSSSPLWLSSNSDSKGSMGVLVVDG